MRSEEDIMRFITGLKSRVVSFAFALLFLTGIALSGAASGALQPSIFLNNTDANITLKEGEPLNVPAFIVWAQKKDVVMTYYLWLEDIRDSDGSPVTDKYYMDPNIKMVKMINNTDVMPVLIGSVPLSYVYATLPLLPNDGFKTAFSSLKMFLCMYDTPATPQQSADSLKNDANAICGIKVVEVTGSCNGFTVSPTSIDKTLNSTTTETVTITVKDCQDNPVDFTVAGENDWLYFTKQAKGTVNANINPTVNTFDKNKGNSASIAVTYSNAIKNIPVTARLQGTSTSTPTTAYTITVTQGANGTISCTPATVNYGGNSTCTITPSTGYSVQAVTVDGASVGAVTSYSFAVVTANHTITATFSATSTGTSGTATPGTGTTPSCVGFFCNIGTTTSTNNGNTGAWANQGTAGGQSTQCTPSADHVVISPSSLSIPAIVGQNASAYSVNVASSNGCTSSSIGYTVNSVSYTSGSGWIAAPAQGSSGTGTLAVTFNTAALATGNYTASITITPTGYTQQTISVSLNVSPVPTAPSSGSATLLTNSYKKKVSVAPNSSQYFYFVTTYNTVGTMYAKIEGQTNTEGEANMLVKYSGTTCLDNMPTFSDYQAVKNYTVTVGNSSFGKSWSPQLYGTDLYYHMVGGPFEEVIIARDWVNNQPVGYSPGCYYIMLVNPDPETVSNVNLSYWEGQ